MSDGYKKPQRYVPGPNDPALPPQLSEFKDKSTDEVLEELNRMPFFMTKLDDTDGDGGSNMELEALKALAYEGEPHEIAENFKNQGNDLYKVKRFRDAREIYTKGIEMKCDVAKINESLYANRAACQLELKNFRSCISDCKTALTYNPKNIKCYFRMGKAFTAINKFESARESIEFGQKIDNDNKSFENLLNIIKNKEEEIRKYEEKKLKAQQDRENKKIMLQDALTLRNVKSIKTNSPANMMEEAKVRLEDPMDFESQMIYPALVMYPTTDEFDVIAEVGELSTVQDLLDLVMNRPTDWFEMPGHENFSPNKLIAFMETQAGGLIKVGKKLTFHDILKKQSPSVPLFDDAIKIYFVPKSESDTWISKWNKVDAIKRRSGN
ncbi:hypothetical protein KAFR_0E02980 [Kazachstania africana CBS 2517]|uniref:Cns1/TTC4 wheel domain-containing protein n=1 Tax=Kazachstania africana (strain ATCC 22294 / BCRC 22015 / CBS 2517 / CECT 1963 / NBRC 1671 / NRRL Y-8276) TaxID=1071382 RepID=H2AVQ0_KAZAF|nr:hypothetical protein KAFR_0E02980 [Kazachstania africana CBS 2517]CCF58450.1 hypothetical protein KAFR_0E02980 [Kazachstania africana CBS 2517]